MTYEAIKINKFQSLLRNFKNIKKESSQGKSDQILQGYASYTVCVCLVMLDTNKGRLIGLATVELKILRAVQDWVECVMLIYDCI